ncbi:hypothetical protein BVC93_29375 [Mycobacterium sp. MS1601]|uniref:hypothetical protein n=1 Tax=Mycobacterium sp. MS1601 TaxID=1936029 RepID=UPI0009795591|nr:hypothetical protein [Mycobacterium sp. MS1601]AQA05798.1 hypothetical protein BVC93_29375 [Mycobacterium sp. MS1601]
MSIDSSVSTDAPAPATTAPDIDASVEGAVEQPEDDYATTAGGPTMIWIFTGLFVLVTWLRRRHRKRRQSH